ncbi:MAG: MotA/TolQ/ExbB proton channel family protein [Pseudomonadota bacterium]|nr:MotA/TolQ/ExbB proton channel family protein [Pseudomonadota bacterium]MEC9414522.1 MotA/TolQ/ExbB proton channel family protein [Pseudomonadota bacterium]
MGDFLLKLIRPDLAFSSLRDFLELGGDVLLAIMLATFIMWSLIIERYWHFATSQKVISKNAINSWNERSDHNSWYARRIREKLISEVRQSSQRGLLYIKTLVAAAPLFGLLGTVTGMVEVFDVMAITGSSNARAMAAGISKATLPTMSGMVASLSGLFFIAQLESRSKREISHVEDNLSLS